MNTGHRLRNANWKTRALQRGESSLIVPRFRVEVVEGRDCGVVAAAKGTRLGIGTERGNELVVTDPAVSRHHCVIEARPQGFVLRDLASTNGTGIGQHRILEAFLVSGDTIVVGESRLQFDVGIEEICEPIAKQESFGGVLGRSVVMRQLFKTLEKVVGVPVTVLLTGETGTGKDAIANAIHKVGNRSDKPFVVVDCGAIPDTLIESELFGHEKGAYTGADSQRIGAFERADGGTLFLDEIGELSIDMQPKLLRALETKTIRRVGGEKTIAVDIRIIAATNRDLRKEINQGGFRSDLYYRINVMGVELPPLRERREDIPILIEAFYRHFTEDVDASPPAELISRLMRQHFPGNVRELRTAVQRAIVLGDLAKNDSPVIRQTNAFDFTLSFKESKELALRDWESRYLPELVSRYNGNLSRAARAVRMDRNHLRKRLAAATDTKK